MVEVIEPDAIVHTESGPRDSVGGLEITPASDQREAVFGLAHPGGSHFGKAFEGALRDKEAAKAQPEAVTDRVFLGRRLHGPGLRRSGLLSPGYSRQHRGCHEAQQEETHTHGFE